MQNIKRNEYFNSVNSGIEIDGYKNFVFLNSRKNNVIIPRACLKIHSSHLHAPLCGIFGSNSGYIARYAPFILPKAPTNCDIHLAESNFQTRSSSRVSPAHCPYKSMQYTALKGIKKPSHQFKTSYPCRDKKQRTAEHHTCHCT